MMMMYILKERFHICMLISTYIRDENKTKFSYFFLLKKKINDLVNFAQNILGKMSKRRGNASDEILGVDAST